MYFKPYKDIETAIRNYDLRTGEVKIKSHNNIYKDERSLIDATVLCKVFKTFEANYDTLKRHYNLPCSKPLFLAQKYDNYLDFQTFLPTFLILLKEM